MANALQNTGDAVDTGQSGARKKATPSEKEREKVFTAFRKRIQKLNHLSDVEYFTLINGNNLEGKK